MQVGKVFIDHSPDEDEFRAAMALTFLIAMLVPTAQLPPARGNPIMVTGHAWAPFISPMGEPFRARDATDDTLARWFRGADRNGDGKLTSEEMVADADRFFREIDSDGDGQIGPEELIHYEWELAPDIQVNSRLQRFPGDPPTTNRGSDPSHEPGSERRPRDRSEDSDSTTSGGGLQGGARYGLLNMPEPVASADADFNRAITRGEFEQAARERFQLLDRQHNGVLTLAGLETIWTEVLAKVKLRKHKPDRIDNRVGQPVPLDH